MKTLLLCTAYLLSFTLYAQNDPCGCDAVLVNGVYNYRYERGDAESSKVVKSFIVRTSYDEFRKAGSGGGGGSYAGIGVDFNMSKEEYEAKQREFKQEGFTGEEYQSSKEILEKFGDQNVLNAWTKCKLNNCNKEGLYPIISRYDDRNYALFIRWDPCAGCQAIVQGSSLINGESNRVDDNSDEVLPKNFVFPPEDTKILIRRADIDKPTIISISIPGRDILAYIPPYVEPIEPKFSCEEIKQIMAKKGIYNVACNKFTVDGYYWEVKTNQRIRPYGIYSLAGVGDCTCNDSQIGNKGETWAFSDRLHWYPVTQEVVRRLNEKGEFERGKNGPISEAKEDPSKNIYVGVYEATCKKYEPE